MTTELDTTRVAYDTVAHDYAAQLDGRLSEQPVDRAILRLFAELAHGLVLDVGSGPGHITEFLADLGADVSGVDLSPEMVAVARGRHPGIHFSVGSMDALEWPDGALGGLVGWYSIIHTPPAELPAVFAEFRRVMKAGGCIALAFQVGDELRHIEHGYGHDVHLDAYRLQPDFVAALLDEAGFTLYSETVREPVAPESVQQAYLIAIAR